jgi:hypothetical protein
VTTDIEKTSGIILFLKSICRIVPIDSIHELYITEQLLMLYKHHKNGYQRKRSEIRVQ